MDKETFLKFFDTVAKKERISTGSYIVEFGVINEPIGVGHSKFIYYSKDGYEIGKDYITEFYEPGSIKVNTVTSYGISGIKNFDKLIDYLDYLYESNIDRLKEEERQKEQRRIEYLKEEERKQKKVNDFMNPKD